MTIYRLSMVVVCVRVCVCVSRVSNSGLLAVWCPPEGRAEPLSAKHEEQRRKVSDGLRNTSPGPQGPAVLLEEQCELFHHFKDSVGLSIERKDGESALAPASFLPVSSYWDCPGSSQDRGSPL